MKMNLNATFNALRLLYNHSLCFPRLRISNFNELPVPIHPSVKAVVVDKDNCIALQDDDKIWPEYEKKWQELKECYPGKLLIVSNSAGSSDDPEHRQALVLEKNTGVAVLRHQLKKPGCREEILEYFVSRGVVDGPHEIAVVGDRLFTDVVMANLMGSYGVWLQDGVQVSDSVLCKLEKKLYSRWTRP